MARTIPLLALFAVALMASATAQSHVTRIRIFPAPGKAAALLDGRITGSIESATNNFEEIVRITTTPAEGQWTEILVPENTTVYRYVKYEAPPYSAGAIAEVEFYSGATKLTGTGFGTTSSFSTNTYANALDGNTATYFLSSDLNDQYVGIDLGAGVQVAQPSFSPSGGSFTGSQVVTLNCSTPGASIIYTTDGTTPAPGNGAVVASGTRVTVTQKSTIVAYATKAGLANSVVRFGTYLPGSISGQSLKSFHTGNSLTDTINSIMAPLAQSGGHTLGYNRYTIPGAPTDWLWNNPGSGSYSYPVMFDNNGPMDHMSTQPFASHNRSIENEAFYGSRFIQRARYVYPADSAVTANATGVKVFNPSLDANGQPIAKSPNVQPWVYVQWPTRPVSDGWSLGTGNMLPFDFWPAATYEEGVANHVFYTERIRDRIDQISASSSMSFVVGTNRTDTVQILPGTRGTRVIPGGVVLARIKHLIDNGQFPGVAPERSMSHHYFDGVHLTPPGQYAIALAFYAAMFREDPTGKVMSAGSNLTPQQAQIYQQIAWDVVQNYPLAGIYQEGTEKVGNPVLSPGPTALADSQRVTFTSSTPGAWFRYTTNGSTPSPTQGLLAISPLTVRPGMTLNVIAFRHGYAPSDVVTATYGLAPGSRLLLHEPFAGATGPLVNTQDANRAWGAPWRATSNSTSYAISGNGSLSFGSLKTSGGLLSGGTAGVALGRMVNLNPVSGPFESYAKGGHNEPRGREIWISALVRKAAADDTAAAVNVTAQLDTSSNISSNPTVAIGYFGTSSNSAGKRYWSLRYNNGSSTVTTRTTVEVVPNQTALLVARIRDGSPGNVQLYVNPSQLGGAAPGTPTLTANTTARLRFNNISFDGPSSTTAFDEVRLGESFGAVTPVPTPDITVSRAGTTLASGGSDAGNGGVGNVAQALTYTLANAGDGALTLGNVTLTQPVNCAPALAGSAPSGVNPGASTPLNLTVTPAAAGPWSFRVTVASDDPDESPFTWTVAGTAISPFAAWTTGIAWNGQDSASAADPDRDGLSNLLEFFHATDPLTAEHPAPSRTEPTTPADGNIVRLKFRRAVNLGDVTYAILASENLKANTWAPPAGLVETVIPGESTPTVQTIRADVPIPPGKSALFLRLRVNAP